MTDPGKPLDPESLLLERVELACAELLPGFSVHERALSFDGRPVADLLGRAGRWTVLVSLIDDDPDAGTLRALDGLALARSRPEILASCLGESAERALRPRVVLVANAFPPRLVERLEPFLGDDLWLVRRRELVTDRGSLTHLERFDPRAQVTTAASGALPEWSESEPIHGFLARIAPDRAGLALETIDRILRIDPEVEVSDVDGALCWRLGDSILCTLGWIDGHLELLLQDSSVPHAIRDEQAIDLVLDWLMAVYLEILKRERSARSEPAPRPVEPAARPGDEPDDEMRPFELRPAAPGPLLTDEEIEAFRE